MFYYTAKRARNQCGRAGTIWLFDAQNSTLWHNSYAASITFTDALGIDLVMIA